MLKKSFLLAVVTLFFCFQSSKAQTCEPPSIVSNAKVENMFTPEQEMHLGDAMFERAQREYGVIDDAEVNASLQRIGDRLAAHLPSSGIRYQYAVADLPDTNAFALVGGRIFVTKKLISFVRNEDELAGVIAHELGHAVVRHGAIDMSKYFKEILGVSQVGDRRDIFNKYNQFIEQWRTKRVRHSDDHENDQQLEADKLGMFAMMAAGYDPNIYTSFWTRFTEAKKTNFFTELFGRRRPADKRLKEMIAAIKTLPGNCFKPRTADNKEFEKWRLQVISFSGLGTREELTAVVKKTELTPLRTDIDHLRFSPNGEFILAQDSSTVYVAKREPFSLLFRFDASGALPAAFTPDSKSIVVHNKNLRVEKWGIAEKSLTSAHEIAIAKGYWQSRLSPDGNILAVYQYNGDVVLYDVATNAEIFKKKSFYFPDYFEYFVWTVTMDVLDTNEVNALNMAFSPDSKYFLAGRKGWRLFSADRSETVAVDTTTGMTFSIGSNVKKLLFNAFTFLDKDKIVGTFGDEIENSGIFSFPEGKRIDKFELNGMQFQKVEQSDFLIVRPVAGAAVAAYDLKAKKFTIGNKKSAFDMFSDQYVAERTNGELSLYKVGANTPTAVLNLPTSSLGTLRAGTVSSDGKWLSVSDRSRGAVWNLETGERKHHVRGFRGSYFSDGGIYADFPKLDQTQRTLAILKTADGSIAPHTPVTASGTNQHGRFLVTRRAKEERSQSDTKKEEPVAYTEEQRESGLPIRNTVLEVRDVVTGSLLWSRDFVKENPGYYISPSSGTIVFPWRLNSETIKEQMKTDQQLAQRVGTMQNRTGDYMLQIVDANNGSQKGRLFVETGEGSFSIRSVMTEGDYIVVGDDENRILVYSLSSGRLLQRFFGRYATISEPTGLIAVSNIPGRVVVYDLHNGTERSKLRFTKPLAMLEFVDSGTKLFALTADQKAYTFDAKMISKMSVAN